MKHSDSNIVSDLLYYLLLLIIPIANINCTAKSVSLFEYITPQNCTSQQYYNSERLQCEACSNDTVSSADRLYCECPRGSVKTPRGCEACPKDRVLSAEGQLCIECLGSDGRQLTQTDPRGRCAKCAFREYAQMSFSAPGILASKQCKKCPLGTMPSPDHLYCVPCDKTQMSTCVCPGGKCNGTELETLPNLLSGLNIGGNDLDVNRKESFYTIITEDGQQLLSPYIRKHAHVLHKLCSESDIRACQHFANLCVLQNYRTEPQSTCTQYSVIYNRDYYKAWYDGLPALFYYNTDASIELNRPKAVPARFNFYPPADNAYLDIIMMERSLNGTFLGVRTLSESNLIVCELQNRPKLIQFGMAYHRKCRVSVDFLLASTRRDRRSPATTFMEFYLRFQNEQTPNLTQLCAIPILDENIRENGQFVNRLPQDEISKWILTERTYFVDTVSLADVTKKNPSAVSKGGSIRYPAYISVEIQIQSQKDGHIMPPYIRIRHAEIERDSETSPEMAFEIKYFMDGTRHYKDLEITMAVLGAFTVVWAAVAAYSWGRRAGKMIIDLVTICKLILFECGILGDVFLTVITAMAVWITFAYKAQKLPYYVMLSSEQEWSFVAYLISATVLKFIALVHKSVHLMLSKTFFIDWEKPMEVIPMSIDNQKPLRFTERQPNTATKNPTVIWRTYLVANEWNELQNYRKTSIAIQMIAMFACLEWLELKNWAAITPGFSTEHSTPPYVQSRLSRFAIVSVLYMVIGLLQWIVHVLIIERLIVDPFHNIIDLCSIANISVLSLTHPLYGFYIHGRSVHGRADTDMVHMNQYLQNERDNLCGQRGLEAGTDLQTFIVNLPKSFRDQYDAIIRRYEQSSPSQLVRSSKTEATTARIQRVAQVHDEINKFLMEFIEHCNTDADYVVRDASFLETLLDMEFNDTTQLGNFTRDKSEMAFSGAFVYGNEWSYMSFELLLFACIHLATANVACSAFVTFTVSVAFQKILSVFFTNNLIKSSYVDQRFLI